MEFGWSPQENAIRETEAAFITANLPANWKSTAALSPGPQAVTDFSKVICPKLHEAGLLLSHWPEEHGGVGASAWDHFIIGEQLWEVGEPRGPQYYNVNWIGPTILEYGTEEQKAYHLGRIREGNVVWCQGFSEPSGGFDLAGIRTKAVRDGDLHEVFFDDVEVFANERLGPEDAGWDVIRYSLNFERVGIPRYALALKTLQRAVAELHNTAEFCPAARQAAAQAYAACEAARMMAYEAVDQRSNSQPGSGVASMARYAIALAERQVADFVLDCRLKVLRGEAGGKGAQGRAVAEQPWPAAQAA